MPDWLIQPRVVLSIAVAAAAVAVLLARRGFKQRGLGATIWILLGLCAAIWVPERWRDYLTVAAFGIVAGIGASSMFWALALAALAYGLTRVVPGGGSVVVMAFVLVGAVVSAYRALRHLRAMARTRRLEPGAQPSGAVQIGGRLEGAATKELPSLAELSRNRQGEAAPPVAAWRLKVGRRCFYSTTTVRLVGEHGVALIEPVGLDFDSSHDNAFHTASDAAHYAADIGVTPGEGDSVELCWIEADEDGYARGIPRWQADPQGGGYRHSPLVPVFFSQAAAGEGERANEIVEIVDDGDRDDVEDAADGAAPPSKPSPLRGAGFVECEIDKSADATFVANRALDVLQRERGFLLCAWLIWGAVCAAIVAVQALG